MLHLFWVALKQQVSQATSQEVINFSEQHQHFCLFYLANCLRSSQVSKKQATVEKETGTIFDEQISSLLVFKSYFKHSLLIHFLFQTVKCHHTCANTKWSVSRHKEARSNSSNNQKVIWKMHFLLNHRGLFHSIKNKPIFPHPQIK